ncbi:tail fiber assembly protein [Enterobacter roggenkampii]|uniref:tail fiber assembly protein n=1 Tax=Enterobacter roggenkampii TaxID=1812935 RepID=UPI002A00AE65|nr:tail fiber assembly protein [Escherichia coli]
MNKYLFSATMNHFYPVSLINSYKASGTLPDDAIEIEDSISNEFLDVPPQGKRRGVVDGLPAWVNIPPPSHEELVQIAENNRQRLLAHADAVMLDWRTELMLGEISDANKARLLAWMAYKNEVKAVDVTTAPGHVNWPVPPEV